MGSKVNGDDVLNLREALNIEIIIIQALIDILVSKGILTQEKIMQKIDEIRKEMPTVTRLIAKGRLEAVSPTA